MISPTEINKLHPLVDLKKTNVIAGLYTEGDGHIDPSSVSNAYGNFSKQKGSTIMKNSDVINLK